MASAMPCGKALAQEWTFTKTANTATFSSAGQVIRYSFVVRSISEPLFSISVTDNKVAVSCPATSLAIGASMTCTGSYLTTAADVANGRITNTATANLEVSGDFVPDQRTAQVTVSFAQVSNVEQTRAVINRFLTRRVNLLVSHEPDRARFVRRIPGALWGELDSLPGGGALARPFNLSGNGDALSSRVSFAGSPSQAMAHAAGRGGKPANAAQAVAKPFDAWIEGHFSRYAGDLGGPQTRGHFNVVYLGMDYLVTHAVLVGVLAQIDWTAESSAALQSSARGFGVMLGPYVAAKLTPNLYVDTRFAWGVSDNRVNPVNLYEDKFAVDRWLASARLTGSWWWGRFRLTPSAGVTFVQEQQRSYTDSLGALIPGQTVSLGRLAIGPELAYRLMGQRGVVYEPHVELKGTWDFIKPTATTVGDFMVDNDVFRLQVRGGLISRWPSGHTLNLVGLYDGVGSSNFRNYGAQFWFNVPVATLAQ